MKTYRILLAVCAAILLLAVPAFAAVPALPPLPAPQLTPVHVERDKDVRRAYYRIGKTEIKATLIQLGTLENFSLWKGRELLFEHSTPVTKPSYGEIKAFTSGGQTFFAYHSNTELAWTPNQHISGHVLIVGKSPVTGKYRIYVDSADYYNPSPDEFQAILVRADLDGVPVMRLCFGKGLFTEVGAVMAAYYLRYDPSSDSFVYEER